MWPFSKKKEPIIATRSDIIQILPDSLYYQVLDRQYILPTNEEVLSALGKDYALYTAEYNDCDDFAFRAKGKISGRGWPFAVIWVNNNHYMNLFVNDKREVVVLEPQGRLIHKEEIKIFNSIIM